MDDVANVHVESTAEFGSPIVFLHGFMGSTADWQSVRAPLASEQRCIFVDLPGHGESVDVLDETTMTLPVVADTVVEALDRRGVGTMSVVGYSMGGRVALTLALRHPDRVDRLVLESASPGISSPDDREARADLDDRRAARIRREGLAAFLDDWYRAPLFETFRHHPQFDDALERRRRGDAERLAQVIADMSPGRQPDLWPRLEEVTSETLLIAGADDPKYPAIVRRAGDTIPDSHVVIAEDCGHNVHLERPDWYAETVGTFLAPSGD